MKSCIKKGCGCSLVLLFIIGLVIFLLKPKWHDEYGERFTEVRYGSRPNNTYDVFFPHEAAGKDSLALILYVHGGSWIEGDKDEHHGDCYSWVQRGYATATMNYSLLKEENVSIQTMLDEIAECIRHIIGFAREKGIGIRQMAIAGTSAGGHLAMLYAYSRPQTVPLRFAAIKVGPADLRILFPYQEDAKPEDLENLVFSCTGKRVDAKDCTRAFMDSIQLQASPVNYINEVTALPAIFAYGGEDGLVKPAHYQALTAAYDSLHKPYDLIVFPNSGHFLMSDRDCTERYESTLKDYCKKYFGY